MNLEECSNNVTMACPTEDAEGFAYEVTNHFSDGNAVVVFENSLGGCLAVSFAKDGEKARRIAEILNE